MMYESLATKSLANELAQSIVRDMEIFVQEDRKLSPFVIWSWLRSEKRARTDVLSAAASTNGSTWELACQLGFALQPLVDNAYEQLKLQRTIREITHVDLFENLLSFWCMDDADSYDWLFNPRLNVNRTTRDAEGFHSW